MSGTFKDIDVPPTLVSFAVDTVDADYVVSPEFKKTNSQVVMLSTDRLENDVVDFEMLKKNRWFQYGLKIALAIGSNVDLDVLREFTDDEELVLQACGAEMLKKLVREIAVTSSKIGSTSMTLTDATGERSLAEVAGAKKEQMVEAVQEMKQDILGLDDLTDLDDMDIEFDEGW